MNFKSAQLLAASIATATTLVALPSLAQNLATVNGKAIPASRMEAYVQQAKAQGQKDSPELRAMIKDTLIGTEIMLQEAEKSGIARSSEVQFQIERARQQIIIQALMRAHVQKNPISDADVKTAYEQWKTQNGDKEFNPAHILVEKEEDAKAIISKLKSGAKFDELAKQSKDQGSAAKGGDLDWITQANVPPAFAQALTTLKKGQFTETPVKTEAGFHVIKLNDVRPLKLPTFDEVKPQIQESLAQDKARQYQDSLMKKAVVK